MQFTDKDPGIDAELWNSFLQESPFVQTWVFSSLSYA